MSSCERLRWATRSHSRSSWARHHRDLLRVAYVICRDPALAEYSAQAAWAIAWHRIVDVKDPDHIRGWLVAVAANEARRTMRSRHRSIHEISVADIELEGVPDLRSDPLADGIAKADLRRVLASLDPTDRALIALRYVAELSSDEIGRALGMSSSGANGRLSRLLLRLREPYGSRPSSRGQPTASRTSGSRRRRAAPSSSSVLGRATHRASSLPPMAG